MKDKAQSQFKFSKLYFILRLYDVHGFKAFRACVRRKRIESKTFSTIITCTIFDIPLSQERRNAVFAVKSSAFGQGIKRIILLQQPFIRTSRNALNYSFKKSKNIATNTNKTVLEYLTFGDYLYACLYDSILKDFTLYKQYTNQRFFPKENPRNSPL